MIPLFRHLAMTCLALLTFLMPALSATEYEVLQPGNHLWYYRSPLDQSLQPYYVYLPRGFDPSQPHPAVVFLHGFGGRASTAAPDAFRQNWADGGGWILARADGRGNQNWDFIGEDDLHELLRDLQQTTPFHPAVQLDTARLYLEGGSMGGHGGYREAFRYPDLFAAVAPAAGWTTYREFYQHFYDRTDDPKLPDYVDPARQPVLETASSLWQVRNGRPVWLYLVYDTNDKVNPPVNQEEVVKGLGAMGSDRFASRVGEGGHVGSYSAPANYHFFSTKRLDPQPPDVYYTTNDLRYNRSYWVTVDRLRLTRQWGSVEARVIRGGRSQRIEVTTDKVLGFTLSLDDAPLDPGPVSVQIDGGSAKRLDTRRQVSFRAWLDENYEVGGWSAVTRGSPARPSTHSPRKTAQLAGPLAEALRTPFTVIYGTRGGVLHDELDNPDWVAAQHFATEWNTWMTLHWSGRAKVPAARLANWWVPPYPFEPGPLVPPSSPLVLPVPDDSLSMQDLPLNRNLLLFGDTRTNRFLRQLAPKLPLELSPPDQPPGLRVASRVYQGEHVNYFFVAPNPLAPDHYVVVARGYLSSRVDPARYGVRNVGKDLEALPFYWPDYVVWEATRTPGEAKQKPFVYLPETWLDAGYFAEDWQLDTSPPRTRAHVKPAGETVSGEPALRVELTAADAPGGFGVEGIEYRLETGPWLQYRAPLVIPRSRLAALTVRATDKCGQFVYDHSQSPSVGRPAPGNVEPARTIPLPASGEN